jgi:hypothetical protein
LAAAGGLAIRRGCFSSHANIGLRERKSPALFRGGAELLGGSTSGADQLLAPERALLTEVKVVLSCVPTAVMVAMITTEMRAAMSPYSMAVAPASSRRNARMLASSQGGFEIVVSWWEYPVSACAPQSPGTCTSTARGNVKQQRKLLGTVSQFARSGGPRRWSARDGEARRPGAAANLKTTKATRSRKSDPRSRRLWRWL